MNRILTFTGYVLLFLFFTSAAFAQNVTVKGNVTDATSGETLIGVTVTIKGTTAGTQTDVNGAFTLSAPGTATLVFTYVGYASQEVPLNGQTAINVKLAPQAKELQQVVVVGYGVQRKRDVTGSIGNVSGEQLAKQPVQTPTQALQGRVSGVQVLSSGQPNSAPQLRIRGTGSILGGANPLYVVDGVLTNDIRNINNADILSVDVLKDASAAIYGVRGANGVVIITTKKGKKGPPSVSYDANFGFREAANTIKMANRDQYLSYETDVNPSALAANSAPLTYGGTTNWWDVVLRKGFTMNHNVSLSGGGDNNTYFVSASYLDDQGIAKTNDFSRFTLRANNDVNITKKLKFSEQLSLTRSIENPITASSIFGNVYRAAPIVIGQADDGRYGNTSAWGNVGNPLLQLDKANNFTGANRVQGNVALDYDIVKSLKFHTAFNVDGVWDNQRNYLYQFGANSSTFTTGGGNQRQDNSSLFIQQDNAYNFNWDNTLTYDHRFDKHHVTVLGGYTSEKFRYSYLNGTRLNVPPISDQWYLALGDPSLQTSLDNNGDKYTRQSLIARANYDYAGKYLLTGSFRRDGSSKFAQKWGNFYTVGGGWVVTEEDFMKDQKVINYLKLRASYGQLGNDNIPSSLYIVTATSNLPYYYNGQLTNGTAIQQIKDPNLKWELTDQLDLGFEYAFLNNRLTGEFDYYRKKVKDALTQVTIPAILGSNEDTYTTNAASFQNTGFEFGLKWSDKINDKFSYYAGGNFSFNTNKVIGLNGGQYLQDGSVNGQFVTRTDNGQPIASYYVLKAVGVFQNQAEVNAAPPNTFGEANHVGGLRYADVNGDGKIDANDRIYAGSYQPKYYGGFNLGFTYTSFDLSADLYYNFGNKIYNGNSNARSDLRDNITSDYADSRFTTARPSTTDPNVITSNTPPSTYFIQSGSFVRMNNLTLGYTIPANALKRLYISRLRIFATAQNLFTITKYKGISPELIPATNNTANGLVNVVSSSGILAQGVDQSVYPVARTFSFGVNVQF
ncbi:SusC/RagA family TonB-linked outer membrane protein [Mucilaginibacter sp. KACC 22063]|uniref:SusC/RagA family TonB-linked outer membrane protein n=1 Tax=Mucilaginibacter sp. KACC 22063 TaxID=3025666 RepID=UPI002365E916|nr:TonB-dependent receptor [Mucilaginibacter sp. KACC 22063]WDF54918.1 TonB-dependent receptor [Mucilaginibacter sp. KACC 22063]